jgi:protein-disulfide isomerase
MVEAEIAAMGEITDAEVEAFYEEQSDQMGGMTLEQVAPRIRDYLEKRRGQEVVEKMVEDAGVEILLERPRVDIAADGPSKGPADAPVTIIEFSDFQCPFCSRALPVLEEVMNRYPDDVRLVYRHLPLDRIHPRARAAAEASLCAEEQGQFWAYHDLLFANSKSLADDDLMQYAGDVGLDVDAWKQCMDEGRTKAKIEADLADGRSVGITGTPAFVINGVMITGARPVEDFVAIIDEELAGS